MAGNEIIGSNIPSYVADMNRNMDAIAADMQRRNNPAGFMHKRMVDLIMKVQENLTPDDELGISVVGGNAPIFHLRSLGFSNPDILIFAGIDSAGNQVSLMQHHSQMSVVVTAVKKLEEQPFRMGFRG